MTNLEALRMAMLIGWYDYVVPYKSLDFIQHIKTGPAKWLVDEQQTARYKFFNTLERVWFFHVRQK